MKVYSRFLAKTNANLKCPIFDHQILRLESMTMPSAAVDEQVFSSNVERLFTLFWRPLSNTYPNIACISYDGAIPLREIYPEEVIRKV